MGGVAAGMSAAARARRLDEEAEIIVLERGAYVSFANCGLPYYVGGEIEKSDDLVLQTADSMHDALTVDVKVGHEVIGLDSDAKTVRVKTATKEFDLPYDALVLAPGADAIRPPIPGIDDSPRVLTLRTVHDAVQMRAMVDQGAKTAVVLGAGFIGLEAAEGLRDQGLDVTVVELGNHILPPFEAELTPMMRAELERLGMDLADAMENCLILDTRRPDEYAGGHLPGALNVPHTQIRERLDEIRVAADGRPIRVHCRSGARSYIAERVLRQEGFEVKNLSGGMLTLKEAIAGGLAPSVKLVFGDARQ